MRRGPTVNRTVPCNQGGEVSRRLDFITILLHFLFPLYFIFKTEYTKIIRIPNDFSGRFCKTFRQQAQQE